MRCKPFIVFVFAATCAWSQAQPIELIPITESTVVATVNGQKFTAGELERITRDLSPDLRHLAGLEPQKFLEQYALSLTLKAEAEKAGIDKMQPYRDQIERMTRDILANGLRTEKAKQITFTTEDLRNVYDAGQNNYRQATAKVIFISRVSFIHDMSNKTATNVTPAEAKEKAARIAKDARAGKEFAALAKEHSDDRSTAENSADFPYPIRSGDEKIPQAIRDATLSAKPGDIVGPVEHNSGFYLFLVKSVGIAPFEDARADIENQLRSKAMDDWMAALRKKSNVSLDHEPFWRTFIAANQEALEARRKAGEGK